MNNVLMADVIQYGFAGFAVILIGVIVWLIKQLLAVLRQTNKIISANNALISTLVEETRDELSLLKACHTKLISRPCIASKE